MKKLFIFTVLVFCYVNWSFSQQVSYIKIIVKDSATANFLNGASIKLNETGKVYKTDQNGNISINLYAFPVSFTVSNIGYQSRNIVLNNPEKVVEILLVPYVKTFNPVVIQTPKPHKVIQELPFYIVDYEIKNDSIYFIGYKNKSKNNAYLIIANLSGDTLFSTKVENPEKLFKDCFGNIHLLSKNQAVQIYSDSSGIQLLYPIDRDEFEEAFAPIAAYSNETFFVKKFSINEQVLEYYSYKVSEKKLLPFLSISNEKNVFMLRDFGRLASSSTFSEADARFEKMCFYKPLFAPIFANHDSLFLFNLTDSSIIVYRNDSLQQVSSSSIDSQLYTDFKDQIIIDPALNNFFALKINNGRCSLTQINPNTSQIINQIIIPDLPYVQKISVWKNKIYFLYSDFCATGYKKLYVLKI